MGRTRTFVPSLKALRSPGILHKNDSIPLHIWLSPVLALIVLVDLGGIVDFPSKFGLTILLLGLFGSIHHMFTIAFLLALPEARTVSHHYFGSKSNLAILFWMITYIGLAAVSAWVYEVVSLGPIPSVAVLIFGQHFIDGFVAFHHATRQSLALSYTGFGSYSGSTKKLQRSRILSRYLTELIGLMMFLTLISRVFSWPIFWAYLFTIGTVALVSYLIIFNLNGYSRKISKLVYFLRCIVWPCYAWSLIAVGSMKAIHALESISVFKKILNKSDLSTRNRLIKTFLLLFVPYTMVLLFNSRGIYFKSTGMMTRAPFVWAEIILPLYVASALMHVVVESFLFKFRHEAIRNSMGRFFLP